MDKPVHIHTPLLRRFTVFYSCLGAQINPPRWTNWRSILSLLWNLIVFALVIYGLYTLDCLKLQRIVRTCTMAKPLFYSFVYAGTKYTYPALFIFKYLYFGVNGHRLVRLLDSPCFRQVYGRDSRRAVFIFAFYVSMPNVFFAWALLDRFSHPESQPRLSQCLEYFCLFMVFNYLYFMCILMHYIQSAFLFTLLRMSETIDQSRHCSWTRQIQLENQVFEAIQSLAILNRQMNRLLNAPLMAVIVLNMFNIILIFSLALICQPYSRLICHMLFAYLYTKYLIWANERIRSTVRQIFATLCTRTEQKERQIAQRIIRSPGPKVATTWQALLRLLQSRRIRFHEADMYVAYFAVNVFHIFTLDSHFITRSGLFILGLVVFFIQTV